MTTARGGAWLATNRARTGTTRLDPANGCRGSSATRARAAANWTRRLGAESASTSGLGRRPVARALRSVTCPRAVAATAARSYLPSAIAARSTRAQHVRPGGQRGGEGVGRVARRERGEAGPLDGLLQREAQQDDLRRHVGRVELERLAGQPEAEVRLGLAPRDLDRDRAASGPSSQIQSDDRVAGELDRVEVVLPGLVGQERGRATGAATRTAGRSGAAIAPRAAISERRRRGAPRGQRDVRRGTARGSPIRPRASAASAASLVSALSSVAISGGTADRSSRPMLPDDRRPVARAPGPAGPAP